MRLTRQSSVLFLIGVILAMVASARLGLAYDRIVPPLPGSPDGATEMETGEPREAHGPAGPALTTVGWQSFSTGLPSTDGAFALAFGEFDGRRNLYAGFKDSGIRVWTNYGTASWWEKTAKPLPTSGDWRGLSVTDLNHDGLEDLAAAGDGGGIRVYLQTSRDSWSEVILAETGSFFDVAVGDLNNDGNPDIVAARHEVSGSGLYVWMGTPAEREWVAVKAPEFDGPLWSVALADFNHDGMLDLAAASDAAPGGVYVWHGNGIFDWTSADTGLPHGVGLWRDVVVADFSNDGKLDLAASSATGLAIWLGTGTGNWLNIPIGLPAAGDYAGLAAGDLDNDGRIDLVAARQDGQGIEPWRNLDGSGQLLAQPAATGSWWSVVLADVNDDGILDLGASSTSEQPAQVWIGSRSVGAVSPWVHFTSPDSTASPRALAAGDVNWDGHLDFVAAMGANGGLKGYRGDGGTGWNPCSIGLPASGTFSSLALGQLFGDAYPELVAGSGDNTGIRAYYNAGCLWAPFALGLPTSGSYYALALGDVDHDGRPELVGAAQGGGLPMWRFVSGVWVPIYSPTLTSNYYDVALGDLDDDGELDIAAANHDGQGVQIWLHDGPSAWSNVAVTPSGKFSTIALGDLNNDGRLDVVAAKNEVGTADEGIFMWLGDSAGSKWTPFPSPATTGGYYDLDLADLNHDGFMDLVAARNSRGLDVWLGNGAGVWTESNALLPTTGTFFVSRFGHIDHDGSLDLLATKAGSGAQFWLSVEKAAPGDWSNFTPGSTWVTSTQTVTSTIQVIDANTGLDVQSGQYAFSTDGGVSWSPWLTATTAGANGTTARQTITAGAVPFGQDSLDTGRNRIKFRIADMAANLGESEEYEVRIDTVSPGNPSSISGNWATSTWSRQATAFLSWSGAADAGSGVRGYSFQWSTSPATVPDAVEDPSGTSSPTTTLTTIPGDGTSWYFHVRARDWAGNWASGALHSGPYWLDTVPPVNPNWVDSSPDTGTWTTDNTVNVVWSGASDSPSGSGVSGYSYEWNTSPSSLPDEVVDTNLANITSDPLPDGESHYFHLRTMDRAGNWSAGVVHYGPFKVDRTLPSNPAAFVSQPAANAWSGDNTVDVSWSGAADSGSGVRGYSFEWSESSDTVPNATVDTVLTSTTSPLLSDGSGHYFHIRAQDNAGNWASDAAHYGPFKIDRNPPSSSVTSPTGTVNNRSFTVSWSGSDAGSGVATYDVEYRDLTTGSAWTRWRSAVSSTSVQFLATGGHTYLFRSRARDNAGLTEDWPATFDQQVVVASEDFAVDGTGGLEVTQAVQDRNNSVVLIANKPTFVRFHAHTNSDPALVSARLSGYRNGVFLGNVLPGNLGGVIPIVADPDRGELDQSFWFQLPTSWLSGDVILTAEINHDRRLAERDYTNNSSTINVAFQWSPPMNLNLVDVCYTMPDGTTYRVRDEDRRALESWLRRAYPISELNVQWSNRASCYTYSETSIFGGVVTVPNSSMVNSDLMTMKLFNVTYRGEDRYLRYYGMVNDEGMFMRGAAPSLPSLVASGPAGSDTQGWDFDGSYADWYGGHELGHSYGRRHVRCSGDEAGWDWNYPYLATMGNISPSQDEDNATALYGFDVQTKAIYPPSWKDVMAYCTNEWISDYTYEGIYQQMMAEQFLASAAAVAPRALGEYLAVFGSILTATDQVSLTNFYRLSDASDWLPRQPGDYSIRLSDGNGNALAEYPFTPRESTDDEAGSAALIAEFVPWVTGTTRVAIYHGAAELASRLVSAHSPTVTVISPNGGESLSQATTTVRWSAADEDGGSLTFSLLYSVDGGAGWETLGAGLAGNSLTISTSLLAGTTQGRFRVIAADGVNTGSDDSDGNFSVPGKVPQVYLVSPKGGAAYVISQTVSLQAGGQDLEDGSLSDSAFTWTSSISGTLGTGRNLALADLPPGLHTITVRVTDSDSQQAQASTMVLVGSRAEKIYVPLAMKGGG